MPGGHSEGHVAARQVAAFDFDGTLVRRDTLLGFLALVAGRRHLAAILVIEALDVARGRLFRRTSAPHVVQPTTEPHHRDDFKERVLRRVFVGSDPGEVAELGLRYAREVERLLRPDTAERLAWHRAEGHETVIVSASLVAYLVPFSAAHGFDHVIAVELAADEHGRLSGELAAPNVRGPEKAKRLRAWLGDGPVELWAYGDSAGDDELLAMADHPTRVVKAGRHR